MQQMWPVGDTPEALEAAAQRAARILDGLEDVYLHAAVDDDYIGVQTYSRSRVGPEGTLGTGGRCRDDDHGLRVLARGARGDDPPRVGP